jgi:hypothetical protein
MAMAAMAARGLTEDRLRDRHRSPLSVIATPLPRGAVVYLIMGWGVNTSIQYPSTPRALQVYMAHRSHAYRFVSALYLIPILHGEIAQSRLRWLHSARHDIGP